MTPPQELKYVNENMTEEEAERRIELVLVKAIQQLISVKGLFKKDKEKMKEVIEILKIIGGYIAAIHIKRRENVKSDEGLQGSIEKDRTEGDKGTDGISGSE